MSIWQKLTLSLYSSRLCGNCGTSLGIEQTGTGWFFVGWIPFSISGLFPLPLKVVFGCIGIALILFPHIYLIPLIKKSEVPRPKIARWLFPWFVVIAIGMFASDWVNLLPSNGTKIAALVISVILAIPIIHVIWQRIPKADEKILAFVAGAVFLVCMHYFALSNLPPAALTIVAGQEELVDAKVIYKRHSNKLSRCSNKVDILIVGDDQKHEICISEDGWKRIKIGDQVLLTTLNTDYGRLITAVEPRTDDGSEKTVIGISDHPR